MPTTHTTPIDLRSYHGREFEGVLNGEKCKGKISVKNNESVFLCHDNDRMAAWNSVDEMFGYPYSWCIQRRNELTWRAIDLSSIIILDSISTVDSQWDWKMQEIVEKNGIKYKCIRWNYLIVSFVNMSNNTATNFYTHEEAYKSGYRKLPSRKLIDITEEMFDQTNLIGRRVMFNDTERTVFGMITRSNGRYLCIHDTEYNQLIHKCKLIEE